MGGCLRVPDATDEDDGHIATVTRCALKGAPRRIDSVRSVQSWSNQLWIMMVTKKNSAEIIQLGNHTYDRPRRIASKQ